MDEMIRQWIVEILQQHKPIITIALRQRAKFEGWLKFELAALIEARGVDLVEVESSSDKSEATLSRSDISFQYRNIRYDVELKTPNTNWRMSGVRNLTRPITKNIAEIVRDATKLMSCPDQGVIAFVLFPVPSQDNRWHEYIKRIANETSIPIDIGVHCQSVTFFLSDYQKSDVVVCAFLVPRPKILALPTPIH
jgi:hypothetical protein